MIDNPQIGDRVSYEDMANPYQEGIIQDRKGDQWMVVFRDGSNSQFEWSDLRQHGWQTVEGNGWEAIEMSHAEYERTHREDLRRC